MRFLGIPQEKIHVVHEAPRKIFKKLETGDWKLEIKKRYGLPNRFVLYVGDVNYNKNILGLAEACKIAKTPLVIVGKQAANEKVDLSHPENQLFAEFLEKYGKDSGILRLGFVPDEDLVAIYNSAVVYCQPSFYEGFGLPVLEAMACGTPVVAAKTQALVEMADKAAFFTDPKKPEDMAEKISELLENSELRAQLIRK
ncbi:glycosyltransferase family 1 protein, partial [Candidatus Woesebacteria bacterium]